MSQTKFKALCGLLGIVGVLDATHFAIAKPLFAPADYFYYKTERYSVTCQAVVHNDKKFLDLYVGISGSTNNCRILRRSTLYHQANAVYLVDTNAEVDGFKPYLIANAVYPLLPWLMVPHCQTNQLSVAESIFNKRLRKARCVIENAFGILKHPFRELLEKSDLDVKFFPDDVVACALLHNMLLQQSHDDIEDLLSTLRSEGLHEQEDGV